MKEKNTKSFQQLLKDNLELIHENTFYKLACHDKEYKESVLKLGRTEKAFMHIQNELEMEHEKIIDDYISALQENNCDTNDLSYVSGLIDMFKFLNSYGFIKN